MHLQILNTSSPTGICVEDAQNGARNIFLGDTIWILRQWHLPIWQGLRAEIFLTDREQELKMLMDRAERSTGGALVNVIAYKNDYVTAVEELKVIEATARVKQCTTTAN